MSLLETLLRQKEEIGFISVKVLEELITPDSVQQFLSDRLPEPIRHDFGRSVAKSLPRARKLIAVLILAELEEHIVTLIAQEMTDDVFPIQDSLIIPSLDSEGKARLCKEQWTVPP